MPNRVIKRNLQFAILVALREYRLDINGISRRDGFVVLAGHLNDIEYYAFEISDSYDIRHYSDHKSWSRIIDGEWVEFAQTDVNGWLHIWGDRCGDAFTRQWIALICKQVFGY